MDVGACKPRGSAALREILDRYGRINDMNGALSSGSSYPALISDGACRSGSESLSSLIPFARDGNQESSTGYPGRNDSSSTFSGSSIFNNMTASGGYEHSGDVLGESQLLWCHKHCFKPDSKQMRNTLRMVANLHGAELACIRRPDKVIAHFRSVFQGSMPLRYFIAVTTWKEAKPFSGLLRLGTATPIAPRFMVIFCESEKQYTRAVQWVGEADCPFPIYCVRDGFNAPGQRSSHELGSEFKCISDLLAVLQHELPSLSVFHATPAWPASSSDMNADEAVLSPVTWNHDGFCL